MPRKTTGSLQLHGDHWDARITLRDGRRPWVHLPPGLTESQARKKASQLASLAAAGKIAPATGPSKGRRTAPIPAGETVALWGERWLEDRKARGLTSVPDDRGRWAKYVLPALGEKPIASVTKRDLEHLVEQLDAGIRAGQWSWKTAANAWTLAARAFSDASASKTLALRAREDNPAAGIRGPDRGAHRAKQYLWPSEFLRLAGCEEVPLRWRRLFVVAVYTFLRVGELEALELADVDLEHGTMHVHQAIDRRTGKVKPTKTGESRRLALEPEVLPLVRLLVELARAEKRPQLVRLPCREGPSGLATMLRKYLRRAGVERAELYTSDATRKNITFHDLRATGITWAAVRGDDPLKIKARAGHSTFSTTEGYIREAENVRQGFGGVFPPLPPALLESSGESSLDPPPLHDPAESSAKTAVSPAGLEPAPGGRQTSRNATFLGDSGGGVVSLGAPRHPSGRGPDDSKTIPSPRWVLVGALTDALRDATAAGDLGAARVALEALGKLLGEGPGEGGQVVDLASRRAR